MKITARRLSSMKICEEAAAYAAPYFSDGKEMKLDEVIQKLHRGDWLIWLLVRTRSINNRQTIRLLCVAATRALKYLPRRDKRTMLAICAAMRWVRHPNLPNCDEAHLAAEDANRAFYGALHPPVNGRLSLAASAAMMAAYFTGANNITPNDAANVFIYAFYACAPAVLVHASSNGYSFSITSLSDDPEILKRQTFADAIRDEMKKSTFKKLVKNNGRIKNDDQGCDSIRS